MATKLTDTRHYTAIADAIRAKLDTSDTYTPAQMGPAIESIPTGGTGGAPEEKDVNFFNFDGRLLYSYDAADFLSLAALPDLPTTPGLTCQGWNWTLADAQAWVQEYGELDIGAIYITDDGKTRLYIELMDRLDVTMELRVNGSVVIDWGDGSDTTTLTGTSLDTFVSASHDYSESGDYLITLEVTDGSIAIGGDTGSVPSRLFDTQHLGCLRQVNLGADCAPYHNFLRKCYRVETVTVPMGNVLQPYSYLYCTAIKFFVFPPAPEGLSHAGGFDYCKSLTGAIFDAKGPSGVTTFQECSALRKANVTNRAVNLNASAFAGCSALKKVIAPYVTGMGTYTFQNCSSLEEVVLGTLTSIANYAFQNCTSLTHLDLGSITTIGMQALRGCSGMTSLTIPATVTSLTTQALADMTSLKLLAVLRTTPPTMSNSNVLQNIPTDCVIDVPDEALSTYKSATNWSTYADRMV